ncbi:unnamed protein product [Polarella glacialis]|uniref:Uncharacterized protein n=1 Tax=Polarella glacialis TaxID=89957 RepID=A0A813LR60_POLGL|nr:unnamed protein product [Polarella glacialis]
MSATLAPGGGGSAPSAEGGGTTGQTHTTESDLRHRSTPPADDCPVDYKPSLDKMDVELRLILAECRVPWLLQHLLAEAEMVTTADLSQAYTKELLHSNYKADFGLHDVYNYPTISETRSIGRLQSALKRSNEEQGERSKRTHSELDVTNETSNSERHNMETVWTVKTGLPAPPLREQCSSKFVMKVYKSIQQNDIGDFNYNQIISENPDSTDKTFKKRRRDNYVDGHSKDADEESRQDPHDYESWERQMTIWRNTLLMCIWSNPQEIRLQISKAELDEFYDYLLGDDIYKRKPQPSLKTIMISERKAWRKIREHLHKGTTLAAALKLMMNDFLFWTREVYEYLRAPTTGPKGGPKGGQQPKGTPKGGWPKGGPNGGAPKGGKGKGQQPKGTPGKTGPAQWAAVDASGAAFCNNYHIRDNCPGGCSRSHICPIIKQGWKCPELHSACHCPHLSTGPQQQRPFSTTLRQLAPLAFDDSGKAQISHQNDTTSYDNVQLLCDIPERYRAALQEPEGEPTDNDFKLPDNYIILILYAGKDEQGSTAAAIQQEAPHLSQYVVEIDIMRDKLRQNMLNDQPYKQLLQAAKQGRLLAILAYDYFMIQADGSPGKPLRGREMDEIWGLPRNTPEEQSKVDNDSILLLRMLRLANVARFHNKSTLLFLLEHPADPALHSPHPRAANCATIWGTTILLAFGHEHRLFGTTFAQCMVGNMVNKMTKLLHNIPLLRQLDNLTCNHTTRKKVHDTKQLARWGWQLNVLIAQGVKAHLKFLRNYDHTQILTDRPNDITTVYVMTQPTQSEAHLLQHGSISDNPFTSEQITEARNIMNNSTTHQLDNPSLIRTGQPFTLPLLSCLALTAGDPDWQFPLQASDALPLGVTDVLPRTPGIWPTTLEMNEYNEDCEQPEPPSDVPNYPSAAEHEDRIEATYIEERALDMTSGPHDPRTVARLCNCREDQISCGALSGQLEGRYLEKLRTIHDATVNSVNLWIQRNQPERTTAPGLFGLLYAIYYLYMVAMIKDMYWINKVGSYGVASAQYHWGRMAKQWPNYAILMELAERYVDGGLFGCKDGLGQRGAPVGPRPGRRPACPQLRRHGRGQGLLGLREAALRPRAGSTELLERGHSDCCHRASASALRGCIHDRMGFCDNRPRRRGSSLPPRSVAGIAWALARAGYRDPSLFQALAQRSAEVAPEFGAHDAAALCWALSAAGVADRHLFEQLATQLERPGGGGMSVLRRLNAPLAAELAWGLAAAGVRQPSSAYATLEEICLSAGFAWAFATAGRSSPKVFQGLAAYADSSEYTQS